jgi:hypothetical protein
MAERIVSYKLKVVQDSSNKTTLALYSSSILGAERKISGERQAIHAGMLDQMRKAETRLGKDIRTGSERTARTIGKTSEQVIKRAQDAAERATKSITDASKRAISAVESSASKMQATIGNAGEAGTKRLIDGTGRHVKQIDELEQKYAEAGREVRGRFEEWAGGVTQLGRGIAELGLLSTDSTDKLVRGLVGVQGTFDTIIGGVKTYQELRRVVEAYAAAQAIASQGLVLTSGRNSAALEVETAATMALARARGTASAAGIGGPPTGGRGSMFGRIGSRIGGAARSVGGRAAGGLMTGAGAVAGKLGMGIGGGAAAVAGSALAAFTSTVFASVSALKTFQAAAENGIGGGAQEGSFVDSVGGSRYNPFSWLIAWNQQNEADVKAATTERMKAELELTKSVRQKARELASVAVDERLGALDASLGGMGAGLGATSQEQLIANQTQQRAVQQAAYDVEDAASGADRMTQLQAEQQIRERQLGLLQEEYRLQEQIGQERIDAAQQSLSLAQRELETAQQQLEADQNRLLTAKERFGQLSEIDQQRLIAIKQRADAGEELTREERSLLRSVGTENAVAQAQQGDLAAADAAGFDRFFGQAEQDRIAQTEQQINDPNGGLVVQVQQAEAYKIKIEQDVDQIKQQVRDEVQQAQLDLVPIIREIVQEEAGQQREQVIRDADQRSQTIRAAQAAGGR